MLNLESIRNIKKPIEVHEIFEDEDIDDNNVMHLLWADPFDSNELENQPDERAEAAFIYGGRGAYIKNFNWKALHDFL